LEDRNLLASLVVDSLGGGPGANAPLQRTLQWAIQASNDSSEVDDITFAATLQAGTITPAADLIPITDPVRIVAPLGTDNLPKFMIDGQDSRQGFRIDIENGGVATVLDGLWLKSFAGDGIEIIDADFSVEVMRCIIESNGDDGIAMGPGLNFPGAGTLKIEDNVIISNQASIGANGIEINEFFGNLVIRDNGIGTEGSLDLGNAGAGILLNLIDGDGSLDAMIENNIVSGNGTQGIVVIDPQTALTIQNNNIGVNAIATATIGNDLEGILIENSTAAHTIAGNIIGGNLNGIVLSNADNTRIESAGTVGSTNWHELDGVG
jgi:hypothetical protein